MRKPLALWDACSKRSVLLIRFGPLPSQPKFLQTKNLQKNCFDTNKFVKITKQSLYKANSFACSLANRDKPVAETLHRECFGGIFCHDDIDYFRGRHGGVEKGGGWKTSRMTPLPKRGFGPPSYGTFSTPLTCQCSVFPVQKSTTEQTRSSFGGVQKFSGERVLWYVFHPPYVLHPPISRPNYYK